MLLHLYWILWISLLTAIISFNYALIKYYTDPHESVRVAMLIQVFAFSIVMTYILLIPFDVFATVRHLPDIFLFRPTINGQEYRMTIYMYDLYFLLYIVLIWLCFIGLPFSYFYAQVVQDEEEAFLARTEDPQKMGMRGLDSSDSNSDPEDLE